MPGLGGGIDPVRLLTEIDAVHDIVDLGKDDDFLVVLACLHIRGNEVQRQLVEDDVVTNGEDGKKRQRRQRGDKAGEQAVIMWQGVKARTRGADSLGRTSAQKEIARANQQNCDE